MKDRLIFTFLFFILSPITLHAFDDLQIHGFMAQGYLHSDKYSFRADTSNGTFEFNEMGINFRAGAHDRLTLGVQFFARDLGDFGNDELKLDWAFADYTYKNWIGFRAGLIRLPHGLFNENRDADFTRTSILLPTSVYNESWRDGFHALKGVSVYGDLPGAVSYQLLYGTNDLELQSSMMVDTENSLKKGMAQGFNVDPDEIGDEYNLTAFDIDYIYGGALLWRTPITGLRIGNTLLGMKSQVVSSVFTLHIENMYSFVASFEYQLDRLTVFGEYTISNVDIYMPSFDYMLDDGVAIPIDSYRATGDYDGYYLGFSYSLFDWFDIGVYYDVFYPDRHDRKGKNEASHGNPSYNAWLKDAAVSLRFNLYYAWIVKLEGHYMDGTGSESVNTDGDQLSRNWFLFAAKVSYSF